MSTILESVNTLSEKLGVTEREQTIKDQLDLCVERLGGEGNSKDIADSAEKFAEKEDGTATFMTKTITENNTYNAADDGVSGYSSVTVNVEQASFTSVLTCIPEINSTNQSIDARWYKLINNDSSTINITEETVSEDVSTEYYTVLNPLKKGTCSFDHAFGVVTFTPAEDFDGLYNSRGNKYTFTGDEVTAGDGYCYVAKITEYNSTYVMKKTNNIFVNVINS